MLTVSLRMQTNPENKGEFEGRSHERYVNSSLHVTFSGGASVADYSQMIGLLRIMSSGA